MKENLDKIFQSSLLDEPSATESWQVPSDGVWDAIENELQEEKEDRFGWLWLPIGMASLVLIGLLLIRQCSMMDRPDQRQLHGFGFTTSQSVLANTIEKIEQNSTDLVGDIQRSQHVEKRVDLSSVISKGVNPPTPPVSELTKDIDGADNKKTAVLPVLEERQNIELATADFKSRKKSNADQLGTTAHAAGKLVGFLPIKPIVSLRAADLFAELAGTSPSVRSGHVFYPRSKNPSWFIVGQFTPSLASIDMELSDPNDRSIFSNRNSFAYQAGLNIEYHPHGKQFGFGVGIQYQRLHIQSDYGMSLNYSSQNEALNNLDGHYDNTYLRSMPSVFGELAAEVALLRLNTFAVDEGTPFDVDLVMEHRLEFVQFPIYGIWRTKGGPLRFNAKAGISANLLLKDPNSFVNTLESNHDALHHRHSNLNANGQGLRRFHLGLLLGLGVEYRLTPGFSLGFEPSYSLGLSPIYKDQRVNSRTQLLGTQFSIRYQIK